MTYKAARAPRTVVTWNDTEEAGMRYAKEQLDGSYFLDWVREQLAEAADMKDRGEEMLPLETKQDALVIAKNMLQQLEWDTKKGLDERELGRLAGVESVSRETHNEFYKGFREALDSSRDWLAGELLLLKGEMRGDNDESWSYDDDSEESKRRRGVVEAPRPGGQTRYKPTKGVRLRVVDRVVPSHGAHRVEFQSGLSIQVHSGSGRDDLLYAMKPTDMRHENRSPGPESRREYQYAALKAVLGDRPANFVVDRDGDVRAILTNIVRESTE